MPTTFDFQEETAAPAANFDFQEETAPGTFPSTAVIKPPAPAFDPTGMFSTTRGGPPLRLQAPVVSPLEELEPGVSQTLVGMGGLAGRAMGRGGKAFEAAVGDFAALPSSIAGYTKPLENLQAFAREPWGGVVDEQGNWHEVSEPLPIEVRAAPPGIGGLAMKAGLAAARMEPQLAAGFGLGQLGVPSSLAAAIPMLYTPEGEIDPLGAAIAAGLPGVERLGEGVVAKALAKLPISKIAIEELAGKPGVLRGRVIQKLGGVEFSSDTFRKFMEAGGGFLAVNAYLLAARAPELLALPEDRRQQAILDTVAQNIAPSLLGFIRGGMSRSLTDIGQRVAPELQTFLNQARRPPGAPPPPTEPAAPTEPTPPPPPRGLPPVVPVTPPTPAPPAAPTAAAPSRPKSLVPALLVNGKPVTGLGEHKDIFESTVDKTEDPDQLPALFQAQGNDAQHVFVLTREDGTTEILDRQAASPYFKELTGKDVEDPTKGLQSHELIREGLHKGVEEKPAAPVPAPIPVTPPTAETPDSKLLEDLKIKFDGTQAGAAIKAPTPDQLAAMTAEERARYDEILKQQGEQWAFTPQPGSEIPGRTFYVRKGATAEEIRAAYQKKVEQERATRPAPTTIDFQPEPTPPAAPPAAPVRTERIPINPQQIQVGDRIFTTEYGYITVTKVHPFDPQFPRSQIVETDRGRIDFDPTIGTMWVERPVSAPTQAAPNEIRDLISSDVSGIQKSAAIKKLADKNGITVKEMQEQIEAEIVKMGHENSLAMQKAGPANDLYNFNFAVSLYNRQPVMSGRTSTSIGAQAYSTPLPLSVALNHALDVRPTEAIYDSTAGNGMLLIGGNMAASHGNEIQKSRADAMRKLGVGTVTEHDATKFVPQQKFPVVKVNPPFGSIDVVNYGGYGIKKLEHLISLKALEAMAPNGRAAIIIGAKMQPTEGGKGAQWVFENYLYGHYNVVGNFEVSGDLYSKQGASWPVRVIVVDGKRAQPIGGVLAPEHVDRLDTWDDVWKESDRIRHEIDRRRQAVGTAGPPGIPLRPQGPAAAPVQPQRPPPTAGPPPAPPLVPIQPVGQGTRQPQAPQQPSPGGVGRPPVRPVSKPEDEPSTARKPGPPRQPAPPVEGGLPVGPEAPPDVTAGGAAGGAGARPRIVPQPPVVTGTEHQNPYVPRSQGNPFGTLSPKGVVTGTHDALDALKTRVGPIDEFVANRLQMEVEELRTVMAAEQIDGAALGIDQIETGGSVIIGDETGIGKGRQGAALIRYANLTGKIPIFFTKDPKLFTDMYGDLQDIHTTVTPLIFGDPMKASIVDAEGNVIHRSPGAARQKAEMARIEDGGWANSGYDAIFATYSQINKRNARQQFLESLADENDTIIILDEAHEAAGDAKTSMQAAFMSGGKVEKGSGPDRTVTVVPGLLRAAGTKPGRGGVLYMSATYAKRPDNMPVYFRTSLSKAADSFSQIVDAMKRGGVALQQAVSEALSKVGQYIRRERDFNGVTYDMKRVKPADTEALIEQVDQVTDVLSEIVAFSAKMRDKVVGDETSTAQSENALSMTDFASIVHNQVGQLLLAAKADAIIEECLAAKAVGEKPVIAVMNTMESFLDHYVEDKGIRPGQPIKLRWNELLRHALERTLRTTRDNPDGSTTIGQADPYEYGLGELYESIQAAADAIESKFPISPIDYILQKLNAAGVKMLELTGRQSGITYTNPESGEGIYTRFKKANKNTVVNQFNSGAADGMLMNASGSTGLSAHASEKFKDQRPRHMIIGQPALDINTFVQTLGRIKRTGMVMRGKDAKGQPYGAKYTHLVLPLQAEIRPAAIAAKKMKSLNANTTAESDAAIRIQSEDIMNKYGDLIVAEFLDEHPELQFSTGIGIGHKEGGAVEVPQDVARKFTGRMAIRPNAEQAQIYQAIIPAYNDLIEQLKATGDYDLEVVVHDDWDGKLISSQELVPGTDEGNIFTAGVRVQKWEIKDPRHVPTGEEMRDDFEKRTGGKEKLQTKWQDYQSHAEAVFEDARERFSKPLEKPTPMGELAQQNLLASLDSKKQRWEDTRDLVHHIIRNSGEVMELNNSRTGESYSAVLVDVKFPKLGPATGPASFNALRVAPSAFRFRFAIDAPGGVIYLHAGSFIESLEGGWNLDVTSKDFGDLTGKKPDARYERMFLVGNPIRGYDATGGVGKVVRFKTQDGQVVTGLLMPRAWDMGKLAKDPRLDLVSGAAATYFLRQHGQGSYYSRGTPIEAAGGVVRIIKTYGSEDLYTISTPSARRTGGSIYLDRELLALTGDFTKVGNKMTAEVETGQLSKVIDKLMQITKQRFRPVGNDNDLIGKVSESNRRAKAPGPGGELYSGIPIPGILRSFEYTFRDLWERIPGWAGQMRNGWRSFTMQAMPRTTASNRIAGETGARSAVAPMVGRSKGLIFASKVTEGITVPDFDLKFGTGLNEDNLRDIKRQWNDRADEAENREELIDDLKEQIAELNEQAEEGDMTARREIRQMRREIARLSALTDADAVEFRNTANGVVTLIGAEDSPFATEAEYREFMDSAEAQDAIDRHVALWETDKDPIYRQSIDLDPEAPLETRGLDYGARVNLKAILPDQETRTTIKPAQKGKFVRATATLKKFNPHSLQAKGTGNYESSYREIMASGFEYEYTVAKQHEYIRALLASGNARVTPKKYAPGLQLKGESTVGYPLRYTPWRKQFLQIRKSLATEYEDATGIASFPTLGIYTTGAKFLTKLSVQGLAEGSTHIANLMSQVFIGLGPTGNPLINALLKSVGRADLLVSLPKVVIKAFGDRREEMLKLAEIAASKEPYRGTVGWLITKVDQGVRLYSAGVYKALAENGYVPNTETGLREFVNHVGQYNKALQPRWIQFLRSTFLQPFATAMQNFNVQGLRTMVTSPGVKASSKIAAAALRADVIAGIIGFVILTKILQLLLTKQTQAPPGTKLGAVGWIGDDGKLHQFDLGLLTGYSRGFRITGLQGFVEAKRLGLDTGAALAAGGSAAFNTGLSTLTGPGNRFLTVAGTGYRPSFPPVREAPVKPPQEDDQLNLLKTQAAANIFTAAQEASPLLDFAVRGPYEKQYWEALQRQFSRYTPKTGMKEETIEKLPEIVQASQLRSYTESLAKEARKLPLGADRTAFIMDRLDADNLSGPLRRRAMIELRRHGAFTH